MSANPVADQNDDDRATPIIPAPVIAGERPTPIVPVPVPDEARPTATDTARRPLVLWMEEVSVSFEGFKALTDVSLELEQGELRCLIGPNGAGKTTLMDVITGKTRPTRGACSWTGRTST